MNRRRFLESSAIVSAGAIATQAGCAPSPQVPANAPGAAVIRVTGSEPFELHVATVDSLQEGMRSGKYTARSITELYLARIDALNTQGPELRAIRQRLAAEPGVVSVEPSGMRLHLFVDRAQPMAALQAAAPAARFEPLEPSLEDVFIVEVRRSEAGRPA